jgi:hypothetical protein
LRNGTTKRARVGALIRSTADHNFYAVESEPRATEHVGDLNGIVALFDEGRRHLKYPAITLDGFRVNVAGQSAREPGSLTVTSIEKTDNRRAHFGRVTKAGVWEPARGAPAEIGDKLRAFACDPAGRYRI